MSAEIEMSKNAIRLSTFADLARQKYELALNCLPCKRWSSVDLDQMLSQGRGDQSFIDAKFKCSVCGGKADKQLRPPVVPYKDSEQLF